VSTSPDLAVTATTRRRLLPRLVGELLGDRLLRTAIPLLINTVVNAVLGVIYWVVAARNYGSASLAENVALVSAMTTLSGICQLNLSPAFAVLVPRAGVHGRRVILQGYAAATATTLFVLPVFIFLGLPHLDRLSTVLDSAPRLLVFATAVVAFNIFNLQDASLVALRRGRLVPVENLVFGAVKLGLVLVLAESMPEMGIFTSWFLAMLLVIPVVSAYVLTRRPQAAVPAVDGSRGLGDSRGRLALDYAGYLFLVSSTVFLPVIALELMTPAQASIFAVCWLTSSSIDLLSTNIGTALAVEITYGGSRDVLRRTVLRRVVPAVAAISLVVVLAAPFILGLYGADDSGGGVLALQLLAVAGVPRSLVNLSIAEARAHNDIGYVFRLRAQNAVVILVLTLVLAPDHGAIGMALAWLVAQLLGAIVGGRRLFARGPSVRR
jgi:O-antigen/teichoic acid export membrane protein